MELRSVTICMALFVLAISQCSEAHSMRRRQAVDDVNYDDTLLGDEATDDETMNDTDNAVSESQKDRVPAKIETSPTHYEVKAGEEVILECKLSDEKTVVQWYSHNELYFIGKVHLHAEEDRYSIANDSKNLLIKNAQVSDSGMFRCETVQKNPVADVSVNHTLLVMQKPTIINMSASNSGIVGEGSDLTLTCVITASPTPTVLWSVTRKDRNPNDRLTEKDGEFKIEGNVYSMHIKNVKKENAGQYYCYAINKLGSDQAETSVVVRGKPRVHVTKTIVNSDLQIEAVLQCSAHEEANPHIRWYKDGLLIEDSESKYVISTAESHSNLTVSPDADGDFGTFTCEAVNDYGTHNRSIELVQSPVVEDLDVDGSRMTWTVHSHQPVEEMEVQLKPTGEDGSDEWVRLQVPVPEVRKHKYDISYSLEDKQLTAGEYQAIVKVKNTKSWGGSNDPILVKIEDARPQYITASVFRQNNAAHSIRPVYTALSTILMYLLVRML